MILYKSMMQSLGTYSEEIVETASGVGTDCSVCARMCSAVGGCKRRTSQSKRSLSVAAELLLEARAARVSSATAARAAGRRNPNAAAYPNTHSSR
jgi:hypothetical protein